MNKRGKSILIFAILLFLISSFSIILIKATDTTSNRLSYSNNDMTVNIKDTSNNNLGEATLTSHKTITEIRSVMEGKDRIVMYYDFNFSEIYPNGLGKVYFTDMKTGKAISKNYYFAKAIYNTQDIPDYNKECTEKTYMNGTSYEECVNIQIGTHKETKLAGWEKLNSKEIPKVNTRIALVTNVNKMDYIDGVWTIAGMKVDRHASWTSGLTNGLISIHTFNKANLASTLGDEINQSYNLTDNTLGQLTLEADGKNGSAIDTNSITDCSNVTFNTPIIDNSKDITISFWFNHTGACGDYNLCPIIGTSRASGGISYLQFSYSKAGNFMQMNGNPGTQTGTASVLDNQWYNIVLQLHNGQLTWYVNGVLDKDVSYDLSSMTFGQTLLFWSDSTDSGMGPSPNIYIDEFYVWNRTLNSSEIIALYDNGVGTFWEQLIGDTTPPETTTPIINPTQPTSSNNLECYATLTDDKQINLTAYWKWYKNDELNLSESTPITNGSYGLITTLNSTNKQKGEQWKCEVLPYDGYNYGDSKNSSSVTILNSPPIQTNPLLKTLTGKNFSTENLICYNQSTYDADNDNVINIYNWYKNSQPLAVLNIPFEINANDYSGNNNDGIINEDSQFVTGIYGKALSFNGVNKSVSIDLNNFPESAFTYEMWFNVKESSTNGRDLFTKYAENDGFRSLITSSGQIESAWDIGDTFSTLTATGITANTWYHFVVTYNGSLLYLYLNNELKDNKIISGNLSIGTNTLTIGFNDLGTPNFNGSIDEVKIYPYALTPEEIQAHYNLEYDKIVSQETSGGDIYMCQVTPNDAEADGTTLNSSNLNVLWGITFNVTSGETGEQLSNFNMNCNNSFSTSGINSPYTTGFLSGSYECTFAKSGFYNKTIIFDADIDKTIDVKMSVKLSLTVEEHTWLEAIYNCLYSGDCSLYNLLLEVNQTTGNIWENIKPTDEDIVIFENITNKVVSSSSNLTINYTINIPIKAGYTLGTYLPIRIGYWFLDNTNTTCYNQGDKPTGVEDPYCQPLIVETIGPMGGSTSFIVKLQPSLPTGNYTIKRIIDIDPNNVWINYGQETIGLFKVTEPLNNPNINLQKTVDTMPAIQTNSNPPTNTVNTQSLSGSSNTTKEITNIYNTYNTIEQKQQAPSNDGVIHLNQPTITGGAIGTSLLSNWNIMILTGIMTLLLITLIICQTIIKIKKR